MCVSMFFFFHCGFVSLSHTKKDTRSFIDIYTCELKLTCLTIKGIFDKKSYVHIDFIKTHALA